ncbi:unnamed protein product, partial [marine sediment metagenome]
MSEDIKIEEKGLVGIREVRTFANEEGKRVR